MGTSGPSRRSRAVLWLAGFVVAFGGASWLVTRAVDHVSRTPSSHPAVLTPGATQVPLDCGSNELVLVGAFNACAKEIPSATASCAVSGHVLEVVIRLAGVNLDAYLLIEVNGTFSGAGPYDLPPWPRAMGTNGDPPKVAVQWNDTAEYTKLVHGVPVLQYGTADLWQSVAGILNVSGSDGRSGTVAATLELSAGNNLTVTGATLSIAGSWRCS